MNIDTKHRLTIQYDIQCNLSSYVSSSDETVRLSNFFRSIWCYQANIFSVRCFHLNFVRILTTESGTK